MTAGFADDAASIGRADGWAFHMPGHRRGAAAPESARALLGDAFALDASELQGIDYLHDASGSLAAAQRRAAAVFGASRSWFLVNGATVGNLAAVLAVAGGDAAGADEVLMMRASHRSVYGGVVLAGVRPRYLVSGYDDEHDWWLAPTVDEARDRLREHPGIAAIHVTSPSYYGVCADVAGFAELAHTHRIPLIVDEAHGAHFASGVPGLPPAALSCGADVVVQSPHKTLSSLTQSSLLHAQGDRVAHDVLDRWLGMLQSTSPSALLLASLDLSIDDLAANGRAAWGQAVANAAHARELLGAIDGVSVIGAELVGRGGVAALDPTKLVVDVSGTGRSGYEVAAAVTAGAGLYPEFADPHRLVVSVGPADGDDTIGMLAEALAVAVAMTAADAPEAALAVPSPGTRSPARFSLANAACTPRAASLAESTIVPLVDAAGRIAAEFVIPYPPGVPLVVPGERLDPAALTVLEALEAAGARIVGPADRSGRYLRVLAEEPS